MKLVKITSSQDPLLAKVPALYESAFPIEERTATENLLAMIDNCPEMTFNAIVEDDEFCGMAVIFDLGICRYLLYLATLDEKRNLGLGAKTLHMLQEESSLPIIGEVEQPTDPIKARRIKFYERNGFHIELENPEILNAAHLYDSCVLELISTQPLDDADECQRMVIDIVYDRLQNY